MTIASIPAPNEKTDFFDEDGKWAGNMDSTPDPNRPQTLVGRQKGWTHEQELLAHPLNPATIGAVKDYLALGNDPHDLAFMYMEKLRPEELMELVAEAFQASLEIEAEQAVGLGPEAAK